MRIAKTSIEEIQSLRNVLSDIETFYLRDSDSDIEEIEDIEQYPVLSTFDRRDYKSLFVDLAEWIASIPHSKILWNCQTMLEQCADPALSYLEYNEDIRAGLELLKAKREAEPGFMPAACKNEECIPQVEAAPYPAGRLSYGYLAVIDGKESFIAGRNIDHAGQIAEKHGKDYELRGCSFDVLYE